MKKRKIKRIVYTSPASGEIFYGATEYDGALTDENILGAFHEVGKTEWIGGNLWVVRDNQLIYRLSVESTIQYTKSWYDWLLDAVRRI